VPCSMRLQQTRMACRMIRSRQSCRHGRSDGLAARARTGPSILRRTPISTPFRTIPKWSCFPRRAARTRLRNVEETGVFTTSMVSRELAEKMNLTSVPAPYGENEFDLAGLTMMPGKLVDAPYAAEAHAALECKVTEMFEAKGLDGKPERIVCGDRPGDGHSHRRGSLGGWPAGHGRCRAIGAAWLHGLCRRLADLRDAQAEMVRG
jgi:hypothetical protein